MKSYVWDLYDWSVQQESDVPSAESDLAAAASVSGGLSKLTIPGADRASEKEVSWFFNVTAINWLGGVGWTSIEVMRVTPHFLFHFYSTPHEAPPAKFGCGCQCCES